MPDGIELPISSASAPRYRYYTVNIVTNKVIGEIPFEDVNYERSVKSPGAFDGKITITDQTNDLDLYNSTLPGKTALYVVRNDEAVWGGIIWGRTYDLVGRSLAISASEFTSYLSHRIVWKTYSHSFTAKLSKPSDDSYVKVALIDKTLKAALSVTDASGNPTVVTVNFTDNNLRKYNGEYEVSGLSSTPPAPADPGRVAFYIKMPLLPAKSGIYDGVGVTMKSDTYDYLRDILTSTFGDFTDIEFPNEVVEPGIKEAVSVKSKQLTISNATHGVATLTTETDHNLTLGQRVEIASVDPMLDGVHTVSEIPNKLAFKYELANPVAAYDRTTKIYLDDSLASPIQVRDSRDIVDYRQVNTALAQNITTISRLNGEVTLTFDGVHNFEKGQKIILKIAEQKDLFWDISKTTRSNGRTSTKKVPTNTFNYKKWSYTVLVTSATEDTVTYTDPKYTATTYDKTFLVADSSKTYAKPAEPVATLVLHPKNSSGYNIGDSIYVDGVDQPQWPYELYDGYRNIYDVSPGPSANVTSYFASVQNPNDDEDGETTIVTYVCDKDPQIFAEDEFEVSDISAYPQLNGRYKAIVASAQDGSSWIVQTKKVIATFSSVSQPTGATLQKNGGSWIAYRPNTSELRYSLKTEPDNTAKFTKLSYKKRTKTVTLTTDGRHNFRIGDRVKVVFGKSKTSGEDKKVYGGTVTITGVSDSDSVSYKLIKSEHSATAPTDDVDIVSKTGTITAVKSSATIAASLDIPIQGIRAARATSGGSSTITVYALDNDLKVGDYVSTSFVSPNSFDDDNYVGFGSTEQPVKVTDAATNYFRYTVGGPTFTSDSANVYEYKYITETNVAIRIDKSTAYSNLTPNVASVDFTYATGDSPQIIVTTDAAHGIVAGRKVTLSGFPEPGTSYRVASNTAANVISISYLSDDKSAVIQFDAPHGLDEIDDIGTRLRVSNAATSALYPDETSFVNELPLGEWFNTDLSPLTYTVTQAGTDSANSSTISLGTVHELSVGDVVTLSGFSNTSYNVTTSVLAVSPSGTSFSFKAGLAKSNGPISGTLGIVSKKQSKLTPSEIAITAATSNGTLLTYTAFGHKFAPGDAVRVSGFSNTAYNILDGTVNTVNAVDGSSFTVSKAVTAGVAGGTLGKARGLIGGHVISEVLTETEILIPVVDFQYDWEIYAAGLTETLGNTFLIREGKTIFDAADYSKLNFTADVTSIVPNTTNTLIFSFPDADDAGYSGTYTPDAGTVKAFASEYRNMVNNQPTVGDQFQLEGFTNVGAASDSKYSTLNLDGYTVVDTAPVTGANAATQMWVYFLNPKVGKTRPKYVKKSFTGTRPKFNRALPAAGNANLNQAPRDETESRNLYTIEKVTRASDNLTATVYVTNEHNIKVYDYVVVDTFKDNFDAFSQNSQVITVDAVTANSITYTLKASTVVDSISMAGQNKVSLHFQGGAAAAHNFVVGDAVTVPSIVGPSSAEYGNATFTILSTSPTSITYFKSGVKLPVFKKTSITGSGGVRTITRYSSIPVTDNIASGILSKVPTIYKRPVMYSKTYGEYPNNAGIGGITFSTMDYSNKKMPNSPIFGSDLQTVAEILDKYSNGLDGFEYRIDPGLTTDENGVKQFTRKFVLIPIYPPTLTSYLETLPGGKLARGQVATPAALGANKVIFEYPGNITNVSLAEKAETSATRIFVRSGDGKAGSGTEVAYSAAADADLLQDNWPLLDKKETVTWPLAGTENTAATSAPTNTDDWGNHDDETDYHKSAVRFLRESKPPAGDFNIDVNGSVTPVIGSYNPGDWCSIIVNDNFVKTRLNSVLEPRKDVIVRKIDSIKVAVPNNPAFPEKITLNLIPDWQVDAVGK